MQLSYSLKILSLVGNMLIGLMGPLFISQLFNIEMDGTAKRAAISSNQEEQKTMANSDLIVRCKEDINHLVHRLKTEDNGMFKDKLKLNGKDKLKIDMDDKVQLENKIENKKFGEIEINIDRKKK